jgi:hypothetical protein
MTNADAGQFSVFVASNVELDRRHHVQYHFKLQHHRAIIQSKSVSNKHNEE